MLQRGQHREKEGKGGEKNAWRRRVGAGKRGGKIVVEENMKLGSCYTRVAATLKIAAELSNQVKYVV